MYDAWYAMEHQMIYVVKYAIQINILIVQYMDGVCVVKIYDRWSTRYCIEPLWKWKWEFLNFVANVEALWSLNSI